MRKMSLPLVFVIGNAFLNAQSVNMPYALFQYSGVVAAGNTISLSRVPVVVGPGMTLYKDLVLQFDVDNSGNFVFSSGFPQLADAPSLLSSSIVTGKYVGPANVNQGQNAITISGPAVLSGGVLAYTFTISSGAGNSTYPSQGTFYIGKADQVPIADRLKTAGITSTAWNWGLATGNNNYNTCWINSNMIIGVSQVGNTLTIASFTQSGTDKSLPTDQIIYTLAQ